jgi:parvulin-like peptidyl-prolyl isomerase
MNQPTRIGTLVLLTLLISAPARAEIVEEIVAWVNGDVITSSQFDAEEQMMTSEAYRRFAGEELDEQVKLIRLGLLIQMIDSKILVDRAERLYDLDKMGEVFYNSFKNQQGIEDEEEFIRLLEQDGMTIDELKERLIALYAPEEVKRFEIGSKVPVGDKELETFYAEHPELFLVPGEVTVREIILLADTPEKKDELRARALEIREKVATDGDFAEMAIEFSEAGTAAEGGLLGPLKVGDLSSQLEEVAFGLPVDEVSEVLETPYGFHILKIESRQEEGARPLDEIRDQLRLALEDQKYFTELETFMVEARAEADWCVKEKYKDRLPEEIAEGHICQRF